MPSIVNTACNDCAGTEPGRQLQAYGQRGICFWSCKCVASRTHAVIPAVLIATVLTVLILCTKLWSQSSLVSIGLVFSSAVDRHGAHNWEGPGALTAMTALSRFCDLVSQHDWLQDKASCDHVIFAGTLCGCNMPFKNFERNTSILPLLPKEADISVATKRFCLLSCVDDIRPLDGRSRCLALGYPLPRQGPGASVVGRLDQERDLRRQ